MSEIELVDKESYPKKELTDKGYEFKTETDTEVAAATIDDLYNKYHDMLEV